jgi:hypothetical protein
LVGRELHGNRLTLWQFLVNVEGFQLEPVTSIDRCNDKPDMITSLCLDLVGGNSYFPAVTRSSLPSLISCFGPKYAEPANSAAAARVKRNLFMLASFLAPTLAMNNARVRQQVESVRSPA